MFLGAESADSHGNLNRAPADGELRTVDRRLATLADIPTNEPIFFSMHQFATEQNDKKV